LGVISDNGFLLVVRHLSASFFNSTDFLVHEYSVEKLIFLIFLLYRSNVDRYENFIKFQPNSFLTIKWMMPRKMESQDISHSGKPIVLSSFAFHSENEASGKWFTADINTTSSKPNLSSHEKNFHCQPIVMPRPKVRSADEEHDAS
jgi:hypothetical protein